MTNASPPQKGIVTQNQDQLIFPNSFRVTNTTPSNPNAPIPLLDEDTLDIIDNLLCR